MSTWNGARGPADPRFAGFPPPDLRVRCGRFGGPLNAGRRASLYTDYTFAVRDDGGLTPIARAYSGLTSQEIREVDRWVRGNTVERFGPVRSVVPELVFELAFEGIRRSGRHKSGVAVRFPRIVRWRRDKTAADIDRLEDIMRLLPEEPG